MCMCVYGIRPGIYVFFKMRVLSMNFDTFTLGNMTQILYMIKTILLLYQTNMLKQWVFQLEAGELNGTLHYQGRMILIQNA